MAYTPLFKPVSSAPRAQIQPKDLETQLSCKSPITVLENHSQLGVVLHPLPREHLAMSADTFVTLWEEAAFWHLVGKGVLLTILQLMEPSPQQRICTPNPNNAEGDKSRPKGRIRSGGEYGYTAQQEACLSS